MPNYIVLRITPPAAMDPTVFLAYLGNLKINLWDISYASESTGGVPVSLGSASLGAVNIVQHVTPFPPKIGSTFASVATAMIPYTAPDPEYVTPDLRLEFVITGGQTVEDPDFYYDVPLYSGSATFQAIPDSGVSAYVTLPAVLPTTTAPLQLPTDGTAPKFSALLAAVNTVLAADPGAPMPTMIKGLTLDQCRNIAYEIVYGPQPPLPSPSGSVTLEDMYTNPPNNGSPSNSNEQARQGFQGALSGYYGPLDANADQLTNFVFSLAAALECEYLSTQQNTAIVEFPVDPNGSGNLATAAEVEVVFTGMAGTPDAIDVPAEYFYALTAQLPPQMAAAQRFAIATGTDEQHNFTQLTNLVNSGWMSSPSPTGQFPPAATMAPAQAVRALAALNVPVSLATLTQCPIGSVAPIWHDWLAFPTVQPGDDLTLFWPGATGEARAQPTAFLNLVLIALTQNYQISTTAGPLQDAILKYFTPSITDVVQLAAATPAEWQTFFTKLPGILGVSATAVLPPFTAPGTVAIQIAAFIRYFQSFFGVLASTATPIAPTPPAIPSLSLPSFDVIKQTIAKYPAFTFGSTVTLMALKTAAALALPGDLQAQAWAVQALWTINELFLLTTGVSPAALQFSVMEALFARGFTSAADVLDLPQTDFQQALIGTVAWDPAFAIATAIYTAAEGLGKPVAPPMCQPQTFTPINPGCLTDCAPPLYLSPLGPIAYLQEMLKVTECSTCDDPFPAPPPDAQGQAVPQDLGDVIAARRGPIAGTLLATRANLETPLPLIDIVNECLEYVASAASATHPLKQGTVYNTSEGALGDHALCADECCGEEKDGAACEQHACHDPATLFAALPEYSTPATPFSSALRFKNPGFSNADVEPAVYDILKGDFSS
jgi:hypothetical protein